MTSFTNCRTKPAPALSEYVLEHILSADTLGLMTNANQRPKLYYFETLNPRKACAAAKYVRADVDFVRVDLGKGEHKSPEHLARNPNGKVPVLVQDGQSLWESLAIMTRLATMTGSDLWPANDIAKQAEVLRWTSWDAFHFLPRTGAFYFEHFVKPRLGLGVPDEAKLAEVTPGFHDVAKLLDDHLGRRPFLVGEKPTVADFCVAAALPHAAEIHLPIAPYGNVLRWHDRLMELPAWRDPWPNRGEQSPGAR